MLRKVVVIIGIAGANANRTGQVGRKGVVGSDITIMGTAVAGFAIKDNRILWCDFRCWDVGDADRFVRGVIDHGILIADNADGVGLDSPAAIEMNALLDAIKAAGGAGTRGNKNPGTSE